jgi:transcriptional regulator with GAF, ATPase, and Fis domain
MTLALGGQVVPPFALEADLLVALARIVGMASHSCELIAKVATLSRRLSQLEPSRPLVAVSAAMRELVAQCELVAAHPVSVLLRGESGTGKEVLARHIHRCSDRAEAAFVAVNCAALPEALIESELFGHERGAFTGATQRHTGRFERASGGTLFLDEVAELPLAVQAKLLRVLQEGCLERVGGREPITVDVRVIAASHRPLEEMLEQGTFRTDLYYRLAVFPIVIPPLRERPEDIPELVNNKLQQMCARMGREVPVVTRAVLRALCAAPWPGNVRELENYVERATILSAGSELVLPTTLVAAQVKRGAQLGAAPAAKLDQAIKVAVERALSAARGKIYGKDGAAAALGLKPSTLQAKMVRLGIDHRAFR